MSDRLPERELDRLLARLPRESASSGFTRRVLGDLDRPPRRGSSRRWLLAAAAAALVLASGLLLLRRPQPPPAGPPAIALEEEHRQLVAELEALKESLRASEPPPVLYLGGDERVDLVLDLRPVWRGETGTTTRPAAYAVGERPAAAPSRRRGDPR